MPRTSLNTFTLALFLQAAALPALASQPDCVWIETERVFDSQRARFTVDNGVLIKGSCITAVGASSKPREQICKIYRFKSSTLLPGLIDTHTHVLTTDRTYFQNFSLELLRVVKEPISDRMANARRYLQSLVRAGVTSIRDLGNSGRYDDLVLKQEIETGKAPGPRLFASGPGLAVGEGQFPVGTDSSIVKQEYHIVRSPEDVKAAIREHAQKGVDLIKAYADHDPNPNMMPDALLKSAAEAAHAQKLKLAVHATTDRAAQAALRAGADSIEHGYELSPKTLGEMARKQVFLVPTDPSHEVFKLVGKHNVDDTYQDPKSFFARRSQRLLSAHRAGVPIAFGSDMYADLGPGHTRGSDAKQTLFSYVEAGLSAKEALRTATWNAAKLLGRSDLGVIKPGALADLFIIDGDPSSDIQRLNRVVFVMKDGRIICDSAESCR